MSSSRSLPPIAGRHTARLTAIRSSRRSVAILVQWSFASTHSRGISSIRSSDIRRRGMGWENIGVLLVHGVTLLLALPKLALW